MDYPSYLEFCPKSLANQEKPRVYGNEVLKMEKTLAYNQIHYKEQVLEHF